MERKTGSCLCGAVKFSAVPSKNEIDACHCGDCRKSVGGPLMSVECSDTLQIEDEGAVTFYGSSDWAERGFCRTCGSQMFWRLKDKSMSTVHAGMFDDVDGMTFTTEIFIDKKPEYYAFAGERKTMTGQEVFDAFMQSKDEA